MPEFVTGIFLILVFAIWLGWLPGDRPGGAGRELPDAVQVSAAAGVDAHARPASATSRGSPVPAMIEALDSDYARTAYLKGLPTRVVVRKHVLRNALLPTIAVVAVQVGYLVGGLVAVEVLFNYQGIGLLIFEAARQKDLPLLTAGVLVIGIVYLVVTLIADILYAAAQPAHPARERGDDARLARRAAPAAPRGAGRALRAPAAAPPLPDACSSAPRARLLGLLRHLPGPVAPLRPDLRQPVPAEPSADWGHRSGPTRTAATSSRACSRARGASS